MKRITFIIGLIGTLLVTSVCFAARISVGTSGTIGNIELIRITIDPYGHPIEDTERLLAEQDVINKFTVNEKIYFSEEERLLDKLQQTYEIEEIHKDGKDFWKCTPKNPKTIQVRKSRETIQTTESSVTHSTEYYNEEEPNPNYLEANDLEKKVVWFQVKTVKKEKQSKNMPDLY